MKIVRIIEKIVIIFILACLLSLIITKIATGKSTIFGIRPFLIASESMSGTIEKGQIILTVPCTADELQIGDIVAYSASLDSKDGKVSIPYFAIHRLIEVSDKGYIFKGDNNITNPEPDEPVEADRIMYKVIAY